MIEAIWMKPKLKMPSGRANKNIDEYIERIYKENKVLIDGTIQEVNMISQGSRIGRGITEPPNMWFRRTIKEILSSHKDLTIKDAVKLVGSSTDFLNPEERSLQNITKAIRKEENFSRFRKIIGYKEINWNKLEYVGEESKKTVFRYGNVIIEAPWDSKYGHLNFYVE